MDLPLPALQDISLLAKTLLPLTVPALQQDRGAEAVVVRCLIKRQGSGE